MGGIRWIWVFVHGFITSPSVDRREKDFVADQQKTWERDVL